MVLDSHKGIPQTTDTINDRLHEILSRTFSDLNESTSKILVGETSQPTLHGGSDSPPPPSSPSSSGNSSSEEGSSKSSKSKGSHWMANNQGNPRKNQGSY